MQHQILEETTNSTATFCILQMHVQSKIHCLQYKRILWCNGYDNVTEINDINALV